MVATYRLQLQPDFGFAEVEALLPYFQQLGVSHLYLSPITEAPLASTHGYDVVDHNEVREVLGGREAFERLVAAAHEAGLAVLLDFVPNHAGVGPLNAYWQDMLAYGPHSPYAPYFDIDWHPIKEELQGKILLPFLGSPYGEVLDRGELKLACEDGRFFATYFENRYAITPASYADILDAALPRFERTQAYWDLKDLVEAYTSLKPAEREKAEALRRRLARLLDRIPLEPVLETFTGTTLHALLEKQYWRLSFWKTAGYEINYRRFFDINGLVALRMEDDRVFWDAHRLLGELLALEGVDGVRIDHVDGLFDPHVYLRRLHSLGATRIWVEKILAPGETLPEGWDVEGTTGYEFMNDVMGVLLQPGGEVPLDRAYGRYVPNVQSYDDETYTSKKLVMKTILSSELFRLSYELDRISEANYHTRDYTLEALREALAEIVAVFDRYRTYLPHDLADARDIVRDTIHRARQRNPVGEPTVYDFVARVILGDVREDLKETQRAWIGRFQQYTAPVAAKGVEDTAFYRYLRLVALNEVGGEPGHFGQSAQAFHARARFRAYRYPRNLLATATHDHKRGEDTRMRLIALAEVSEAWEETVRALDVVAADHRTDRGPARTAEYLFFQILVALWQPPQGEDEAAYRAALPDRLWPYMEKASREGKRNTSWIHPDPGYEEALETFVRAMLADARTGEAVEALAAELARLGFANTLSQLVLKMTTPGVPDFYQGTELLDLSLVDPDNRRPVDYALRRSLLDEMDALLQTPDAETLRAWIAAQDGRAKVFFTARLLRLRRDHPALCEGDYQPLDAEGEAADHWLVFARTGDDAALLVCVPRWPATLPQAELTVPLPEHLAGRTWYDLCGGARIEPGDRLRTGETPLPWVVLLSAP